MVKFYLSSCLFDRSDIIFENYYNLSLDEDVCFLQNITCSSTYKPTVINTNCCRVLESVEMKGNMVTKWIDLVQAGVLKNLAKLKKKPSASESL